MSEPVGPPADQLLRLCLCIEQHLADVLEGGYSGDEMAERIPWTAVSAALLAEGIEWSPTCAARGEPGRAACCIVPQL